MWRWCESSGVESGGVWPLEAPASELGGACACRLCRGARRVAPMSDWEHPASAFQAPRHGPACAIPARCSDKNFNAQKRARPLADWACQAPNLLWQLARRLRGPVGVTAAVGAAGRTLPLVGVLLGSSPRQKTGTRVHSELSSQKGLKSTQTPQ